MILRSSLFMVFLLTMITCVNAASPITILSWEGYIRDADIQAVNAELKKQGYGDFNAKVIKPYAQDAKQMFSLIRTGKCDISFLTLFFIKMDKEQTSKLVQPINTSSPRLSNYAFLNKDLTHLKMGMDKDKPLYIPWGGGVYGFYINRKRVAKNEVPTSVTQLWDPRWKGRLSLNKAQYWYNIGLTFMSKGQDPFTINTLALQGKRNHIKPLVKKGGAMQLHLNALYAQAGDFWDATPRFRKGLDIVSSWGPEIARENKKGGKWERLLFTEGDMVWLDTINFMKNLNGRKLEAAEVIANYFIGIKVQERIANELSMIPSSTQVTKSSTTTMKASSLKSSLFVPPFTSLSKTAMSSMVNEAERSCKAGQKKK